MCLVRSSRVPGRGRMLLGFHTTLELLHHLRARTSISPTGGLSRRQHICMRRQHKSTHANTRQLQTCVQALKSRLVLKAKQSSMARYLSSHPERRMTLSTTCMPVRSEQRGPNRTRSDAPRMKPLPPKQALTSSSSAGGPAPLAITQATSSPHFFPQRKENSRTNQNRICGPLPSHLWNDIVAAHMLRDGDRAGHICAYRC